MPVLKSCCFCGSLRTGTIFAALAGALLALVGIILIFTISLDLRVILLNDILPKSVVTIIIVINFAMTIFISMLLLIGTIKRNMYFMLPWVLLGIMMPLGVLISTIFTAYNFFSEDQDTAGIICIVLGIIACIVVIYMWLVVFSFFQIVKKENEERAQYTKAPFRRY
ncbi:uncharacterized protein [Onthophagus taurus]|uniref:uncharacterized protein n=1 Tax=Onthophagus taurus TaxID=166361 RepID=UPI000C20331D|nr:uncharacterized protein LOC111417109 [Onthophagus taurus]